MVTGRVSTLKDLVRAASPVGIEERLSAVVDRTRRWNRWLNNKHPYNKNIVKTLSKSSVIDGPRLGEYIASSALLHLSDGWNYLSRAFDAASSGDRGSAYHLAYYAELRAAMSLLANEGIGIFNTRHIALDDHLQPTEFKAKGRPLGTHKATWSVLSAWSRETNRSGSLLEAITIESRSLSDWLAAVGVVYPSRQLVARKLLRAWSVDLKILSRDSDRRNEMSYRPSRIRSPAPQAVNACLEVVNPVLEFWVELEPEIGRGNIALDLALPSTSSRACR